LGFGQRKKEGLLFFNHCALRGVEPESAKSEEPLALQKVGDSHGVEERRQVALTLGRQFPPEYRMLEGLDKGMFFKVPTTIMPGSMVGAKCPAWAAQGECKEDRYAAGGEAGTPTKTRLSHRQFSEP
jgi:hypothetical protein